MKSGAMSLFLLIISLTALRAQTELDLDSLQSRILEQDQLVQDPLDLEIGEMIFDETITKVGRDFYDQFFKEFINPTPIKDFSITIKERPMPGIGTQITVSIDDMEIMQQFIQPNQEMIEMLSTYTVQLAQSYLVNYQEIQAQLQSEDQAGTGIY
jgi:curli production assembly/transport component CsgE